ncbi:MAG: nucleotidyltransferase family protein [Erysipelotrichaceae bacterium]|nr:nucleotidyltransferase family protein [Erysipelotrichaceae bacterium]
MNETYRILLDLTGRALFGYQTDFDASKVDWEALYKEVVAQSLTVIIYDCLSETEKSFIPADINNEWQIKVFYCIAKNEQLAYEQNNIIHLFNENGVRSIILKGSSSALCYPKPEFRVAGDVDILVGKQNQSKAINLLLDNGYTLVNHDVSVDIHHIEVRKRNIIVEVHKEVNGASKYESTKDILESYFENVLDQICIDNDIPHLDDTHQAISLLLHKIIHLIDGGFGLRHLCDWAVFVDKKMDIKLYEQLEPILTKCGMLHFTGVITKICVMYLHLNEDKVQWAINYDDELCKEVMNDILQSGNFGRKLDNYGEHFFTDMNSTNRITSLYREMIHSCHEHWPVCKKYPVLMIIAPFVNFGIYYRRYKRGERPKFEITKVYKSSKEKQQLYKNLKLFYVEKR